jgi:hypothetical protein
VTKLPSTFSHRVVAALLVLLPLIVSIGGGNASYTMYARSVWFRLDIVGRDDAGNKHAIAPSLLARRAPRSAVPFFVGADHFRRTYGTSALEGRIDDITRLACEVDERKPASVDVTLVVREGDEGAPREKRASAACPR